MMDIRQSTLPERRDLIRQLRDSGTSLYQHPLFFQGNMSTFPAYAVDVGFPCYRLGNGRTRAAQLEAIATKDLPEDFFRTDPDSEPALQEQDLLLREMITEAGLLRTFKRVRQDQPLILDNDGYVVNGNRRLCAMRMLLQEDEDAYGHFRHVQVIFLSPCEPRDIKELEGRLQVQPDIRADYSWTAEGMLYRDWRQQEWSDAQIADLYQKKVSEVRDLIAMLEDAECYLDSREKKGIYSIVGKKEYAFRQLQKSRRKCGEDEPRKQLLATVSYLMLDDPDTTAGRLYEGIPDAFKFLDNIANGISREVGEAVSDEEQDEGDLDLLGEAGESSFVGVINTLKDPENAEESREVIRDTIQEMRAQEKERKDATYCFRQVQQAYTKLQSTLSALDEDADTTGIDDALKNIEQAVSDIREWLSNASNQD